MLLSEWIYMIADRQPAIDRNIYYDRAEEAKAMEDRVADLEATLKAMERDRDELWCRALTIEDLAVINRITRRFFKLRAAQQEQEV